MLNHCLKQAERIGRVSCVQYLFAGAAAAIVTRGELIPAFERAAANRADHSLNDIADALIFRGCQFGQDFEGEWPSLERNVINLGLLSRLVPGRLMRMDSFVTPHLGRYVHDF